MSDFPPPFNAVLRPNRSLGPKGFMVLMGGLIAISFFAGVVFVSMGAWPVLGFFGLDMALVYLAFRLNYRSGRIVETIEIKTGKGRVERVLPDGRRRVWFFEPYWLRIQIEGDAENGAELSLTSHGKTLVIGEFLSHVEKIEFARILDAALAPYKTA